MNEEILQIFFWELWQVKWILRESISIIKILIEEEKFSEFEWFCRPVEEYCGANVCRKLGHTISLLVDRFGLSTRFEIGRKTQTNQQYPSGKNVSLIYQWYIFWYIHGKLVSAPCRWCANLCKLVPSIGGWNYFFDFKLSF